jgi:tRNA A-37 threonylcarbamoyl transferase component Bud32
VADRWWMYDGELFWASADRAVKVYLLHGGKNLWRFEVRTIENKVTFHSDVQMGATLEVQGGKPLPLSTEQKEELRAAISRAIPRGTFEDIEQYVVDRVVADNLERGMLSLRRLRLELNKKYGLDVKTGKQWIERLAPRYVHIVGDSAYVTPLGLLRSERRGEVQLIVEVTLRAWMSAYDKDPELRELAFGDFFGGNLTPEIPFQRAWRVIDAFKLGTNGSQDKWLTPDDIEELVFGGVTDLEKLWAYNQEHRRVPRPWPFAVERQTTLEQEPHSPWIPADDLDAPNDASAPPAVTSPRNVVVVSAVVPSVFAIGPATIPLAERTRDSDYGMQYGKWQIGERIGAGAYGRVYESEHVVSRRPAAMKILELEDDEAVARFEREASSLGTLSHPSIPQVLDADVDKQERRAFIVTELLHGASLDRIVTSGWRANEAEALALLRAAATPLALAHDHGIVHRDIKPANLFIEETTDGARRLMLLDFGCAKLIGASRLTKTGVQLGSPAYRSPESWKGEASAVCDVWSLGVTILEVITGRQPFLGDDEVQTMFNILQAPVPTLDTESYPFLAPIVARCLQREPDQRPTDASALLAMCRR